MQSIYRGPVARSIAMFLFVITMFAIFGMIGVRSVHAATLSFATTASYATGAAPDSVTVADFNGDGKLDLATSNLFGNSVSVLIGNGDSSFGGPASYAVEVSPISVANGDFNGDSKPDLVVANNSSASVSVLLNSGKGTFGAQTSIPAGATPTSVAVADVSGDGKLDIVVARHAAAVTVLLGNGNGTFTPAAGLSMGGNLRDVTIADFNGDGKPDLAVASFFNNFSAGVFLGNGNGSFQGVINVPTGAGAHSFSIVSGDFNADGKLDFATANLNGSVSVIIGNGNGTFQGPVSSGPASSGISTGDLNGDGKLDLAGDNGFNSIAVMLNNGNGTFASGVSFGVGSNPQDTAMGDFNGDNQLDIAIANQDSNTVSILRNTTLAPTQLTLVNDVALNEGGTAVATDWTLVATGPTTISGTTGSTAVTNATVSPGTYILSQTGGPSGYTRTTFRCLKNATAPVLVSDSITLAAGDTARCTTINSDIAGILKIVKVVVNDNGGTKSASDFSFEVNGGNLSGPFQSAFNANGQNSLSTGSGTYNITEPAVEGYTASYNNCTNVFLPNGSSTACTITNDDNAPTTGTLTLVGSVNNDNGGTLGLEAFQATIDGTNVDWNTAVAVAPGTHTASQVAPDGYYPPVWGGDCASNGSVTLAAGENKTCTIIYNDFPPQLHIVKVVLNDNGGTKIVSDFSFDVNGTGASFFDEDGQNDLIVSAGQTYTVTEPAVEGYTTTYNSCSNLSIPVGGEATCTITNSDQPGTLHVKKIVTNNNSGNKEASDFSFQVNGGSATVFEADGQNDLTVDAGTYSVIEPAAAGYTTTYRNCSNVVVPNGGEATCTITNDDNAPTTGTLTVHVDFVNDNGGTGAPSDATLKIDGNTITQDTATTLSPGSHNLEWFYPIPFTYQSSISGDCDDIGAVNIVAGGAKSCTITFTDKPSFVVVTKHVINDNGGTSTAANFTLHIDATDPNLADFTGSEDGRQIIIDSGVYHVTENAHTGYTVSYGADCSGTIGLGETKLCTVTNNDQPGTLHVKKIVINDNGGTKLANNFSFQVNGGSAAAFEADGQNDLTVNAGTYNVTEPVVAGYTASYANCTNVAVTNGGEATCTITNNDNAPTTAKLTLVKSVINDSGGTTTANAWTLAAAGPTAISGKTGTTAVTNAIVNPGAYTLSETGPGGYTATQYSCVKNAGAAVAGNSITLAANDTATCTITNNDNVPTGTAAISGTKYEDKFGAGVPLDILLGKKLSGWTIYLDTNNNGQLDSGEQSKVTDANGAYAFTGLAAGTYTVREVQQSGWKQTLPNNDKYSVTLTNGQNKTKVDFGNFKLTTVAGTVFEDKNGNKKKDTGEGGLAGWTLTLKQNIGNGSSFTATTDASGNYQFANVTPGLYTLTETVKTGWNQTTSNPTPFVTQSGTPVTGQNFGNKKK